ncbi:MAG: DNA polymerase/3'-5' exonuclease PolX [Gemmataceae bacterium]|nr:DNA polymerase/3'-5' exonuclease PolX [Gemmataceae bacterium]MDW8263873.1 DNA polymerase/3'-5' exonuclease PolX [Gemmataceae bacterium]
MDKARVAAILDEIGTLLELQGENPFRCNAYHKAARTLEQLDVNLADLIQAGKLDEVPGIGETLRDKITTLVTTGHLPFYEELKAKFPPGLLELLRLPSLGPKKVKALYEQLGIDDLAKLKAACEANRVASLRGFGAKTQQKILEGIQFLDQTGRRVRLDQASALADLLAAPLRACPGVQRLEVCGSLRRRKETIQDIDILCSSDHPGPVMDRFVSLPGVLQVIAKGETKASVMVQGEPPDGRPIILNADLRVVRDAQFPFALHYFTGSKEHNIAMRARAQARGLKLNEYELAGPGRSVPCRDEAELFAALGLDWIPPELREQTGEIEAAEEHRLPKLVELADIRGVFHCHTNWSDGGGSIEQMAEAARRLGLQYLGIADHSQSLTVANGLSPERVRQQHEEIDRLNARLRGFRLFKGTECDILPDGSLDFDDRLLATFDYVVASVHTHFHLSEKEQTERICRALRNPYVTMLGHATGRLLLKREGYKVDLEAVLQEAARTGTLLEINGHPMRLDLDWVHCKRAKALGVKLVINPDAHSPAEIAGYRYGVDVARRGWLEKGDVFNTLTAAQVAKALAGRRKAAGSGARRWSCHSPRPGCSSLSGGWPAARPRPPNRRRSPTSSSS